MEGGGRDGVVPSGSNLTVIWPNTGESEVAGTGYCLIFRGLFLFREEPKRDSSSNICRRAVSGIPSDGNRVGPGAILVVRISYYDEEYSVICVGGLPYYLSR